MIIKIPFDIIELDNSSFHLFVKGTVNGQSLDFIIDTGASRTVFALNKIESLIHNTPSAQPDIQSAGINAMTLNSHQAIIENFGIGEMELIDMQIILLNLSPIDELYSKVSKKIIGGLIGSDFLLKYKAVLNYGNKILTLKVPKSNLIKI